MILSLRPHVSSLRVLYSDRNELTGEIPDEIFELNSLKLLDLDNNQLTGVIQDSFEDLPNLRFLTIGNNAYDQQPMPSSIGGLSKLCESFNFIFVFIENN